MKNLRYLENVSTLSLEKDKCIGCGLCAVVCPHRVFEVSGKKAEIKDLNACIECGACVINCPVQAVKVNPGVG
jgi:NAD-dependent dihydropyrimidine dehydrogenase PreA subunit